jgi:hypothetical protein
MNQLRQIYFPNLIYISKVLVVKGFGHTDYSRHRQNKVENYSEGYFAQDITVLFVLLTFTNLNEYLKY